MKKTFSILLAILLTLALLICACAKDEPPVTENSDSVGTDATPSGSDTQTGAESDIDSDSQGGEADSESDSESDTVPFIPLGTQQRPAVTQPTDSEGEETDYTLDSSQMSPNEEDALTEDSAYWDSQFAGAAPGNR